MEDAEIAALHKRLWDATNAVNEIMSQASDAGLTVRARIRNDGEDPENLLAPKSRPQIETRLDRLAPWPQEEPKPSHLRLVE